MGDLSWRFDQREYKYVREVLDPGFASGTSGTKMTTPIEYTLIKSGLNHLTKYMAKYFKGLNIRVNALSPGGILDNQPKKFIKKYNNKSLNKGMLNGYDLRGTLIYLLSDMSKHLNGQIITVDDGFSL